MHELGIMQSTLDIALEWADRHGADRIERLGMRVGALSGVVPDALQFAFEVIKRDTIAATAQLDVESVPLQIYCRSCEREFVSDGFSHMCTLCDGFDTEIRQGRELEITYVELASEGGKHGTHAGTVDRGDRRSGTRT
jgi:hydrogenase nickel incorporation protein HypA/HybF